MPSSSNENKFKAAKIVKEIVQEIKKKNENKKPYVHTNYKSY